MQLPTRQTVIAITAAGGPEVLKPVQRPVPVPRDGEVLIRVSVAGINRHDCGQRRGGPAHAHSDVPGLEVAGEIVALGNNAAPWRIGDRVCALVDGGGYAQYAIAPASNTLPLPVGFSAAQAAALPEALFTAWYNFFDVAHLAAGERVLIHGGTSGVGTLAIQMLVALGHEVFATCGDERKCEAAVKLGATRAINYREDDFRPVIEEATGGHGVDVILDMSGGAYAEANLDALAYGGRIVHISGGGGKPFSAPLPKIMRKRAIVTGSLLRPTPVAVKAVVARNLHEKVWPLLGHRIAPIIDSTFALEQASEAHARMERNEHIGKILLAVAHA